MKLEYMKVYDLIIAGEEYKGIYLGKKRLKGKLSHNQVMLTNKPTMLYNYSLFRFNKFKFKEDKIVISYYSQINIPGNQRFFYQNLLETKLKEQPKT
jgi:hypothetical protein